MILMGFFISLIPAALLYGWMRKNLRKGDAAYQRICDRAMRQGLLCTFVIVAGSAASGLLLALTGWKQSNPLLYQVLHNFVVLALVEEAVKYLTARRVMKKNEYPYSWLDVTAMMTLVGMGFGIAENIIVAIDSGIVSMLIRAVTIGHGGYGFVEGYFYGKGVRTGKNGYTIFGFLLIWLIHGLYDFSLSEDLPMSEDYSALIAVSLALVSLALVVVLIVFFARARKMEIYMEPLYKEAAAETAEDNPAG